MTGAEVAAQAAATGVAAVGKIVDSSSKDVDALSEAAASSPGGVRAAELMGARMAAKQKIANQLLRPIAWAFGASDYLNENFYDDLSAKLSGLSDSQLTPPDPVIAVPVTQALAYSHQDENLKDMYLNLLASASTTTSKSKTHPSFVEIIRQLSGREAPLLNQFLEARISPMASIKAVMSDKKSDFSFIPLVPYVVEQKFTEGIDGVGAEVYAWFENWSRLGLVDLDFDNFISHEDAYSWVKDSSEWSDAEKWLRSDSNKTKFDGLDFNKGRVVVTSLGEQFFAAVRPLENKVDA